MRSCTFSERSCRRSYGDRATVISWGDQEEFDFDEEDEDVYDDQDKHTPVSRTGEVSSASRRLGVVRTTAMRVGGRFELARYTRAAVGGGASASEPSPGCTGHARRRAYILVLRAPHAHADGQLLSLRVAF